MTDKPTLKDIESMIIGGVVQTNKVSWLYEDMFNHGIDIDFEEHLKECKNEYHDDCYFNDTPTYIIGFKLDETTGKYDIDTDKEYSAIMSETYTQVVHSKYYSLCALCSPCFPNQGDNDTKGNNLTYALPESLYDDERDEHLPIHKVKELLKDE